MVKNLLIFLISSLQIQNCQQNDIFHDQLQECLEHKFKQEGKQRDIQFEIQQLKQFQMKCLQNPIDKNFDYSYQKKFQKKKILIPQQINEKCQQQKIQTVNQAEEIHEETIEGNQQAAEEICVMQDEIYEQINEENQQADKEICVRNELIHGDINEENQQADEEICKKDVEIHKKKNQFVKEEISKLAEQIFKNDKNIIDAEEISKNSQLTQVEINKENQMFYQILSYIQSKDQDNCIYLDNKRKCKKYI